MSKLALMYACGDCFNHRRKKKERVELRTYTGAGTNGSGTRQQHNKEHSAGKDANAKKHEDVSVHGTDPEKSEDGGKGSYYQGDNTLWQSWDQPCHLLCPAVS